MRYFRQDLELAIMIVKLRGALNALIQANSSVKDDALMEKICSAIEQDDVTTSELSQEDSVKNFIKFALATDGGPRHKDLRKVAFSLVKRCLQNPVVAAKLEDEIRLFELINQLAASEDFSEPVVKICCLQFVSACLDSSAYSEKVANTGLLERCVVQAIGHSSVFVSREAQKVIVKALEKSRTSGIMERIIDFFRTSSSSKATFEGENARIALGYSGAMCTSLEQVLKSSICFSSNVGSKNLEKLCDIIDGILAVEAAKKMSAPLLPRLQILNIYLHAQLAAESLPTGGTSFGYASFVKRVAELFGSAVCSGRYELLATMTSAAHHAWSYLKNKFDVRFDDDPVQLFFVSVQIVPVLGYFFRFHIGCLDGVYKNVSARIEKNDEAYKAVVEKLRMFIKELQPNQLTQLAIQAAHGLRGISHLLSKENSVTALQAGMMLIVLQGYVCNPASQQLQVAALDLLSCTLSSYRLTLGDSYESVCLIYTICYLCDRSDISTKVVIKGFRTLQQALKVNALPLEIALSHSELSSKKFSSHYLARSLKVRASHVDWELRDSVLETLTVFVEASVASCIPLREWLVEHNMLELAVDALKDGESYVRASGYQLLTSAVGIPSIWTEFEKTHGNFVVDSAEFSLICNTITHLCDTDIDWESKLNALEFWRWVIDDALNRVGVIDGVFPPTIFDTTLNRIINMTDEVARQRLRECLDNLCSNGCMVSLLDVECDLEATVRHRAMDVLGYLMKVLVRYDMITKYASSYDSLFSRPRSVHASNTISEVDSANSVDRDEVIEALLDGSDVEAVWKRMTVPMHSESDSGTQPDIQSWEKMQKISVDACLGIFRSMLAKNEEKLQQTQKVSEIESYLDDVLIHFGIDNAENDSVLMDCY
ncbi:unnamed protein product [Notodromas monacha]|uniref:Uncharacterized protein n=1 Tax=Notodromas monacha TaxID=399045 RepID=A0A7R9BRL0_9CRUS|nr:unnamed protein product [Notodromas monacha]CAG0919467.1 unnamed protein product [Notodromas monacha]